MLHKAWNSKGEMPYCFPRSSIKFQGHTVQNVTDFDPNWAFLDYRPVAAFKSLRFALFQMAHYPCIHGQTPIWKPKSHTEVKVTNRFKTFLPLNPPGWRGIVVTVRAGGCQTCRTHISVTAWRIFSIRSFVELSRPLLVHCHGHLPICPIWACPWAKNLSNLPQIGSRLCGSHISETAGWMYPI